jgi:hypothetical protein
MPMTNIASFQCSRCKSIFKPTPVPTVCEKCAGMLYVRYDFFGQWEYPDAVFYPTGGGVGLIGMWKAFEEMEELGW